jgi:DNA-dependent RNA polymerase auxiliary subunit epsilon
LQKLNLARCALTGKGVGQIAHALSLNRIMPTSLQYLNLAENTLKDDINVNYFIIEYIPLINGIVNNYCILNFHLEFVQLLSPAQWNYSFRS